MKLKPTPYAASILLLTLVMVLGTGCRDSTREDAAVTAEQSLFAEQVKQQYLHAWQGYKQYAWGNDDLKPLSKSYHNWYAEPLLMSAVDALDGLILMGLTDEADLTREYIATNLSFDKDIVVKNFEIVIRLVGGLLSSYQLSGDERLLTLAEDLGRRLLPVFNSPTGMPYTFVNLRTGEVSAPHTNPAEIGTLILELGTLSKLTGDPVFYDKAKAAVTALFATRSPLDLVGQVINVETGECTDPVSHLGGCIDSYYEYLLKGWKLFGDEDLKHMWETHISAINEHVAMEVESGLWYGRVNKDTGETVATLFGGLDAFFPGVLALSGDLERAKRLQASCYRMWTLHGLEPELLDFSTMRVVDGAAGYPLRPEIIESAYYLYHFTGDRQYQDMGKTFLNDLVTHCRTEAGFAAISDVRTKQQYDSMESFLFGETLKYLYLLFAPDGPSMLDEIVFTTEAHPIRRTW